MHYYLVELLKINLKSVFGIFTSVKLSLAHGVELKIVKHSVTKLQTEQSNSSENKIHILNLLRL